jgi:nucleoside-diphosphate-sugar epimerase
MSPKRLTLLVTGATGFIGGSLACYFDKLPGYHVVATGRSDAKGRLLQSKGISFCGADLSLESDLNAFSPRTDMIVHAAGLAAPWGKRKDFHEQNVSATKNLLVFALRNKVSRFVFLSSASVYTSLQHQFNLTEKQLPSRFINHYAESKYLAELAVLEAGRKGLPVTILRPRAVIGVGDTTVLPRIIRAHLLNRLPKIGGDQVQTDITTITNLTEAVRLSLALPDSVAMDVLNITDGSPVHLWTMIDELFQDLSLKPLNGRMSWPMALTIASMSEIHSRLSNREPALPRYVACFLGRSLTLNIDRARLVLGYKPIQTTHNGMLDFIQFFRNPNKQNRKWERPLILSD